MANTVRDSAVYPNGRFSKINEKLSLLNHAEAATLAAHGLGITKEQMKVEATKLVAPMLRYGTGGKFSAGNGRWNLHNRTFVTPMTIKSWALIYLPGREDIPAQFSATAYADNIRVQWGKCGLKVPMGNLPVLNWPKDGYKPASAVSVVESAIALARTTFKLDPNLLLFILPEDSFNAVNYREIKRELNITRGIASQVLLNTKIHRNSEDSAKMQYLANIAMKVNVKLGGLNCISDENFFFGRPGSKRTMVLGADITHADSEDLKDKTKEPPPSYAALVGTWDRDCHCYTAVTAAQKTGEAMVKDFKRMVQVMLDRYSAKNKILAKTALPQHGTFSCLCNRKRLT